MSRTAHAPKPHLLVRETFRTSREMDFFNQKELVTQTGHDIGEWPFVFVKEALDNSTDACEDKDIPPVVEVTADAAGITVKDNGPGLPEKTLADAMNFAVRVSSREAYVSPCRGAQGNALQTLIPMPRVLDPDAGRFVVVAHGKRHAITCGADPITQRAVWYDDVTDCPKSKNSRAGGGKKKQPFPTGTSMRMEWAPREKEGQAVWPFDSLRVTGGEYDAKAFREQFRELVEGFALFNPHLTVRLDWFGRVTTWKATLS